MQIISHRGFWNEDYSKNSKESFENSFSKGFGTETDLRDYKNEIVISHNIPNSNSDLILFEDFLQIYKSKSEIISNLPLALNIKADGLQEKAIKLLTSFEVNNYFFFDMSVPDHLIYQKLNAKTYSRQSEFETLPALYEKSEGIWLDSFVDMWYDEKVINGHLIRGKKVAVVSFELHKRNHKEQWYFLKSNNFHLNSEIILCTDFPEKAKKYFYEK